MGACGVEEPCNRHPGTQARIRCTAPQLRKRAAGLAVFAVAIAATAAPAKSDEFDPFDDLDRVGAYEVWAGVDAATTTWLAYSGLTVAPFGDTHSDGFRLRSVSGLGQYRYEYSREKSGATNVKVDKAASDLLVGYQVGIDNLTVKGFLGWAFLARDFTISGQTNARGTKFDHGPKASAELWLDWSEASWASLDIGYAAPRQTADVRLRFGQRLENEFSAGPEVVYHRTDLTGEVLDVGRTDYGNVRLGAFVRYDWFGGEVSASGGISTDVTGTSATRIEVPRTAAPYGTLTVLLQF